MIYLILMRLVVSWEQEVGHLAPVTKISEHIMWFYTTVICLQVTKVVN